MTACTEESKIPPESVFGRFPDRTDAIKVFCDNSPTIREICADYEQIVAWIKKFQDLSLN